MKQNLFLVALGVMCLSVGQLAQAQSHPRATSGIHSHAKSAIAYGRLTQANNSVCSESTSIKAPKARLSARQKATASQVLKRLDALQKQLAATRNFHRVDRLVTQAEIKNQGLINALPKNQEPRVGLQAALGLCRFYATLLKGDIPESRLWEMETAELHPMTDTISEIRKYLNQARTGLAAK